MSDQARDESREVIRAGAGAMIGFRFGHALSLWRIVRGVFSWLGDTSKFFCFSC